MLRIPAALCFLICASLAAAANAQEVAPTAPEPGPALVPQPPPDLVPEPEPVPDSAQSSDLVPVPEPTLALVPEPEPVPDSAPAPAPSPELGLDLLPLPVDIHAFVSQGFIVSTDNNYLARSTEGSFEFTELAINFTSSITDELRVGLQLFSRMLGPDDNYIPVFDWAYADYRFADWLGIRVGKSKIPFGLYNESANIDAARVPVLLPYSIYPTDTRELFVAVTGAELYGDIHLGDAGDLEYRLYGGTFPFSGEGARRPGIDRIQIDVRYILGGRLMWLTPLDGLQLGASFQALRYDTDNYLNPALSQFLVMQGALPEDFAGMVELDFPIRLWVASAEYAVGDLLLAAEYGRWSADLESSETAFVPNGGPTNERYYVMASHRLSTWFVPGVHYSGYYLDVEDRKGREKYQHDLAATLRFDLTANWLLKLEGHLMLGTAALDTPVDLNDGKAPKDLAREWGLFLVKTTAYF